jgi:hypothetical protein
MSEEKKWNLETFQIRLITYGDFKGKHSATVKMAKGEYSTDESFVIVISEEQTRKILELLIPSLLHNLDNAKLEMIKKYGNL